MVASLRAVSGAAWNIGRRRDAYTVRAQTDGSEIGRKRRVK